MCLSTSLRAAIVGAQIALLALPRLSLSSPATEAALPRARSTTHLHMSRPFKAISAATRATIGKARWVGRRLAATANYKLPPIQPASEVPPTVSETLFPWTVGVMVLASGWMVSMDPNIHALKNHLFQRRPAAVAPAEPRPVVAVQRVAFTQPKVPSSRREAAPSLHVTVQRPISAAELTSRTTQAREAAVRVVEALGKAAVPLRLPTVPIVPATPVPQLPSSDAPPTTAPKGFLESMMQSLEAKKLMLKIAAEEAKARVIRTVATGIIDQKIRRMDERNQRMERWIAAMEHLNQQRVERRAARHP